MAVTFQSVQTSTGTGGRTVTKPTGTVEGDLLVAHFVSGDSSGNITAPAGWTLVGSEDREATTRPQSAVYYKIAGSSEGADYTFTPSGSENTTCSITRITGHHLTSPINASNGQVNDAASTTCTSPGVTPAANCLLLFYGATGIGDSSASAYAIATSNPTWTERVDIEAGDAANGVGGFLATATRPETTATGNATATVTSARSVGHLIAIAPGADVTGTQSAILAMTTNLFQVAYGALMHMAITVYSATVEKWARPQKSSTTWTAEDKTD